MIYRFGEFELDTRVYSLRSGGEETRLQPRVYRILKYFLDHRDRVISKDELCEHIWPEQFISNATLESAIRSVRKAVGDSGREQRIIQTVWGYGYRLIAEVTELATADATATSPVAGTGDGLEPEPPAFVGRQRELMVLQELLADVEGGRGHIVSLVGAPGIGKTRLLQAFQQRLESNRFTYVEGSCESHQSTVPYGCMRHVVRQICGLTEPYDGETVMSEMVASLQAADLSDEKQARYLCHLLGVDLQQTQLAGQKPEWIRVRTVSAVCELLLAHSRQRPLVLAVDDLQWIDRASETCLLALIEQFVAAPVLVVATHVSTYQPKWGDQFATRRRLAPLTTAESLSLIRECAGLPLSEEVEQTILAKAAGQPLFLRELTRWATANASDPDWPQITWPEDVQSVIQTRLAQLPNHATQLIRRASVLGVTFTRQHLEDALSDTVINIETSLGTLQQQGWINMDDQAGRYALTHTLARDVVYDSLPVETRRARHLATAQALETRRLAPRHDLAAELAYHDAQAGVPEKAVQRLVDLAERAMTYGYPSDALIALQDGLGWVDRLSLEQQNTTRFDLTLRQAQALFALGQEQVALDLLASQTAGLSSIQDDSLAGRYALLMGQLHRQQQAWTEMEQQAQRAVEMAGRCGDDIVAGCANVLLAEAHYSASAFQDGMSAGQRAVQRLESSAAHVHLQLAVAHLLVGLNARALGAFADAQRAIEQMRAVGTAIDDPHVLPFADWAMGWIQATYGAWDEAIVVCQRSLSQAPDPLSMALALGWLGYAYVEKSEAAEAVGLLEQATYHVRQLQRPRLEAIFTIFLGRALLATDDLTSARDMTHQGLALAQSADYRYGLAWGHRTQGQVALAMQSATSADIDFRHALSSFADMGARFEVGRTHLAMADLTHREDPSAAPHLTEALTIFNQLQLPYYIEQTQQRQRALRHQ